MKKLFKSVISLLLTLALTLGLVTLPPMTALAATGSITYVDANGILQPAVTAILIEANTKTLGNGWYYVGSSVTTTDLVVSGNARIILTDGCNLTANATSGSDNPGIRVEGGNILTIYGQLDGSGKLTATSDDCGAGIGGHGGNATNIDGSTCGTITINGGTVTVVGNFGAGIGGGRAHNVAGVGGSGGIITINGGMVTSTSNSSAGIGGGANGGNGGIITINGGTVNATGNSSGIGGASNGSIGSGGGGGNITITGGTVTATGNGGAGIGGGNGGSGGNVTITGGTVTATSNQLSAGIGGGGDGASGNILIFGENTIVTAKRATSTGNQQDIGKGDRGSDEGGVFVALPVGNLTLSGTPLPAPNKVAFTANSPTSGTVTAELPAPFNRTINLVTGLDAAPPKDLSVIAKGMTQPIKFVLFGYSNSPISKTCTQLMQNPELVAFDTYNPAGYEYYSGKRTCRLRRGYHLRRRFQMHHYAGRRLCHRRNTGRRLTKNHYRG